MTGKRIPSMMNERKNSFSKRQSNAFKKENALYNLCALESAFVVLSSVGNGFPFHQPCSETVMKRLTNLEKTDPEFARRLANHEVTLSKLNGEYLYALKDLEAEKKRGKELKQLGRLIQGTSVLDVPVDNLNLNELLILQEFMGELTDNLHKRMEELAIKNSNQGESSSASTSEVIDPSSIHKKDAGGSFLSNARKKATGFL